MTEIFVKAFLYTLEHAKTNSDIAASGLIAEMDFQKNIGSIKAIRDFGKVAAILNFNDAEVFNEYWTIIGTIFCTHGFVVTRNEENIKALSGVLTFEQLRNLDLQRFLNP